jgi:uncharacterized alpha-E superfamily protein
MLLSRMAEGCFWLGRYLERAADLSGALLAYEQLRLDLPGPPLPAWDALAPLADVPAEAAAELAPGALVARLMVDRENPSSLLGALHRARENLRRARFLFPFDAWQTLNPLYLRLQALEAAEKARGAGGDAGALGGAPADLAAVLAEVVRVSQEFAGQIAAGMPRDEAHAFLRIGVHLERSDMMFRVATAMTRALRPTEGELRFADVRWMGLLKSVGAYHTYRRRYQGRADFRSALQLLLLEPTFPRSFAHALQQIDRDLETLPRSTGPHEALRACWQVEAARTPEGLERSAREAIGALAALGASIEATYFAPVPFDAGATPARVRARATQGQEADQAARPG